ncbi:hypothetical protein DFH28DRAFT_962652 [Melampsora americana]|nr:hypothetical protein DFH28DRAFT_962652 [Melampsora americana]
MAAPDIFQHPWPVQPSNIHFAEDQFSKISASTPSSSCPRQSLTPPQLSINLSYPSSPIYPMPMMAHSNSFSHDSIRESEQSYLYPHLHIQPYPSTDYAYTIPQLPPHSPYSPSFDCSSPRLMWQTTQEMVPNTVFTTASFPSTPSQSPSPNYPSNLPIIKKKKTRAGPERICVQCGTKNTPEWRSGPTGQRNLCNACGLRYRKNLKNHSNVHKSCKPLLKKSIKHI